MQWRRVSHGMGRLLDDEGAQATTEYILMLSIIVMICIGILKKILTPLFSKITKNLMKSLDGLLFAPGAFHSFPIGR